MRHRLGWVLVAVACVACFLPPPLATVPALGLAVAGALLVDRKVLATAFQLGITLAAVAAAVVAGAVVTWSAGPKQGMVVAGALLLRLLVLVIATGLVSRTVDADTIVTATRRLGLQRLGLVLGLSLNCLPRLVEAVHESWLALRVRAGSRRQLLRLVPGMAEVVLAHTARIAEEASAAAALRGHGGLLLGQAPLAVPARVVVVTGPTGCGKTSAVVAVAEELRAGGVTVAGIVQPGIWQQSQKVGFLVRDLATGEEAELARRTDRDAGQHGTSFAFSRQGLQLARQALVRTAAVLVIDELGPMELRGHGHLQAVRRALAKPGSAGVFLLVVRRHLVPSLLAALDAESPQVIDVSQHEDQARDLILQALGRPAALAAQVAGSGSC